MQILVAQQNLARDPSAPVPVLPVGVVRWRAPEPRLTVIVKATYALAPSSSGVVELRLSKEPLPLSLSRPSNLPGTAPGELEYATDFVEHKPGLDMALAGYAHAPAPTLRIDAKLRVGEIRRNFSVVAGAPSTQIPLTSAYVREADFFGPTEPVSARVTRPLDEGAVSAMSGPYLEAGAPLELVGLVPAGDVVTSFPTRRPRALLDHGDWQEEVPLVCDTAWIDTDHARVVLVFRGSAVVLSERAPGIDRIILAEAEGDRPVDWTAVVRALHRGSFAYAVEEGDLDGSTPPDPFAAEELAMARYGAWGKGVPEPILPLDGYAAILAKLVEHPDRRADTLKYHDLDEDTWTVEERAWLERIAEAAEQGDGTLAAEFGERFLAVQDLLGGPAEAEVTLDTYIEITVAIETAGAPTEVLAARGLWLAAWMRIERRWARRASEEPDMADELARRLELARAAAPPQDQDSDDEEG